MASFDPLAGSQIDVDPSLKPKPSKELAARRQQLIEMFMQKGATPEQAAQEADAYLAKYPAATGQSQPTAPAPAPAAPKSPQESMEADLYAQGYSEDEARKQAQLQAELRAEREAKQLEQDLSQGGYGQRRVPSPRGLDGRSTPGAPFASVKDAEEYTARPVDGDGLVGKSAADGDMRARGYEVVVGPDGRASYMVAYDDGFTGGPGRAGARPDLTESGKYELQERRGLNDSKVKVLAPTQGFKDKLAARDEELMIDRIGESSGIGLEAAREAFAAGGMDAVRSAARAGRAGDRADRKAATSRLMQARYNPMEYLGREDINDWQQFVAAEQILGAGGGWEASVNPRTGQTAFAARRGAGPNDVRQADAQGNRGDDVRLAGMQAQLEQAAADRAQQQQQFEARMAADAEARSAAALDSERRFEQQMAELRAAETRALAQARVAEENNKRDNETARAGYESREAATQAEREAAAADAAEREKKMQREMLLQAMESKYGPGVRELVDGWTDTPSAQDSLRKIAASADQSMTGFYNSDAARMDAILERIGMSDPSLRRDLVNQYGLSGMTMGNAGGRSGVISGIANFFSGQYSR